MNENMLTELVEDMDYANLITKGSETMYCSFEPKTPAEKKILYKAMSSPEKSIKDCQNLEIKCRDVFCETVECKDDNGSITRCPRVVLIDDKGVAYQSVSFGVYNCLKRLFTVYGFPTWEEPITLIPKLVTKGKNQITTLEIK